MIKLLLILLLLAGCATPDNSDFSARLDEMVGNNQMTLVEQWGQPDNTVTIDASTQVYTYVLQSSTGPNNPYPGQVAYSAIDSNNLPPNPNADPIYYCNISFTLQNGLISSYSFNGDNCLVDILPADN